MSRIIFCFRMLHRRAPLVALVAPLTLLPVGMTFGQVAERQGPPDPGRSFSYEVSAGLLFRDELKFAPTGRSFILAPSNQTSGSEPAHRSRSLGLEYARMSGRWAASPESYVALGLRPDALTRRTDLDSPPGPRETDTRAGSGFQQKPRIALLDTYEFGLRRGKSLTVGAGVFDEMTRHVQAFPEILEFGLNVVFPAKVAAVRLGAVAEGPAGSQEGLWRKDSRLAADLYVYQGDEDRAEIETDSEGSYDRGTSASDPYQGGAALLRWSISPLWQTLLFGGGGDTAIQDGKRNDFFMMCGGIYQNHALPVPMRLAAELRVRREKFNTPASPRASLERRAVSFTAMGKTFGNSYTQVGLRQGVAQSHATSSSAETNITVGDQLDVSQVVDMDDGLQLAVQAVQERRSFTDDDGSTYGAFGTRADATRQIRRFALQLSYTFSDGGR